MSVSALDTHVPFVDMALVNGPVADELRAAFERLLSSSAFIGGSELEEFESQLAAYVGAELALGMSSGTSALQLALEAAGIGPGDEVILPPNTFFATAEAIVSAGATPVFADVDDNTALIDPDAIRAAVTSRTAAVVPVHLYGQPCDMDRIDEIARKHSLFVLEDACQAIGARWDGRPAGSLGHAAAFSFYPGKNLGALGDAGAVTTSDLRLAQEIDILRNHGQESKYVHVRAGYNHRMDALQAAFLAAKLPHLPAAQAARDTAAARYLAALGAIPGVKTLQTLEKATHVHHLLVVCVANRDAVVAMLRERGVGASIHYPHPIHLEPAWKNRGGATGQFPVAEAFAASVLSLPLYPGITERQVDYCLEQFGKIMGDQAVEVAS